MKNANQRVLFFHLSLVTVLVVGLDVARLQAQPLVTSCQSTCSGDLGENIFPEGNFGQGQANVLPYNPGLAPGYTYTLNPPPDDGYYTIANSTIKWTGFGNTWIKILDNGPEANGYMMVVNASVLPGLFYRKKVPVCENTLYEMSVDLISMNNPALPPTFIHPEVAFEINGATVCETGQVPIDGIWHTYRFSFTTLAAADTITLSFRNNAPGGYGNDLAIDNIAFRACGPEITVSPTAYFCPGDPAIVQATLVNSPYNNPVFQWQWQAAGNGTWTDLPGANLSNATVGSPNDGDQYRLLAANSPNNLQQFFCRSVSQTTQLQLEDLSAYAIGGIDTILCNGEPAQLDAGDFASYHWSNNSASKNILAPQPGWYAVTVTSSHGCTATDSLFVYEINLLAEADWRAPVCPGDSTGYIRFSNWTGGLGSLQFGLSAGATQPSPLIKELPAGSYTAFVEDSLGCRWETPVLLEAPPVLEITIDPIPTVYACDTVWLTAQSNFPLAAYSWEAATQIGCRNCPSAMAMPLLSTIFQLTAQDERGCRGTDSILLEVLPRIDVYAPNVFYQDFSENGPNNHFTLFAGKSAVLIQELDIYDRWGTLVFQGKNMLPGDENMAWDGTGPGGQLLEQGVYTWRAVVVFTDRSERLFYGDVTLLRR